MIDWCVVFVLCIVKKWISICGNLVVLSISFKFKESVLRLFLYFIFGFKNEFFKGVVVFIWVNILVMLKLNFVKMIIEIINVLVISNIVFMICI